MELTIEPAEPGDGVSRLARSLAAEVPGSIDPRVVLAEGDGPRVQQAARVIVELGNPSSPPADRCHIRAPGARGRR